MSRQRKRSSREQSSGKPPQSRWIYLWAVAAAVVVIGIGISLVPGGSIPSSVESEGDVAAGEALFQANCARCHGDRAGGTDSGPPLIHDYYVPNHHSDAAFLLAARNGVRPHHWDFGPMPAIEGVSDAEISAIISYIRDLQRQAGLF